MIVHFKHTIYISKMLIIQLNRVPGCAVSFNLFIKTFFFYIVLNTISQENRVLDVNDEKNRRVSV